MRNPASPDFSGWNCTPPTCAVRRGRERVTVHGTAHVAPVTGAAYECVKYDVGAIVQPVEQRRGAADAERIPPDVRDLQCARAIVQPARSCRPAPRARASRAPLRCLRTATACRGRSRGAGAPLRHHARWPLARPRRATAVAPKCPTPGTTTPRRTGEIARRAREHQVRAGGGEPLAHGGQVPGAVVHERDHHDLMSRCAEEFRIGFASVSELQCELRRTRMWAGLQPCYVRPDSRQMSPFVLGSARASCRSFEHATRRARANALNTAST